MILFGAWGPIGWRANKQDTVTTSSTEANLGSRWPYFTYS